MGIRPAYFRYPGVQPFRASERNIFFGRREDIDNLYDLILLEKIVVLFGKSGYGKSSLLSAGVLPRFSDPNTEADFHFRPLEVRFGNEKGNPYTLLDTMRRIVEKELPLQAPAMGDTLWHLFKARQEAAGGQFLLVFDQFEEFFSYPQEQQQAFRWQLAELLFTRIPQGVRDQMEGMSEADRRRMVQPMQVKAVFSIRSDHMSQLDGLKDAIPTILHRRFELKALSRSQAEDAIVKPARETGGFESPPFEYQRGALDSMLGALSKEGGGVEAFLLQILCEHVEYLVVEGAVPDLDGNGLPDVTEAQLPKMSNLLGDYVGRKLSGLPSSVRPVAQRVLEEGLLAEDSATGDARRTSIDGKALLVQFRKDGLTQEVLDDLEKNYLVRREPNTVGGFSYELSHDRLVEPVQVTRQKRRAREELLLREKEQQEQARKLLEANQKAALERKRRKVAALLAWAAALTAAFAIVAAGYAYMQYRKAQEATKEAQRISKEVLDEQVRRLSLEIAASTRKIETYRSAEETELTGLESLRARELETQRDSAEARRGRIIKSMNE